MNIFVAGLDYGIKNEDLAELFNPYGNVVSAKVIFDRDTGKSRGFGFVEIDDDEKAQSAIKELDGTEVKGRSIVVKRAEPKRREERSANRW